MNIYLIRHAESVANETGIISGDIRGIDLSERGKAQAKELGKKLRELPQPDAVFSSPAQRAQETAHIALTTAGISRNIKTDARLTERGEGDFAGKTKRSLVTAPGFPTRLWRFISDGKDFALVGGESVNDTATRMKNWLEETRQSTEAETVFVFSHEMAIKSLLAELLSWSKIRVYISKLENASIRKITHHGDGWQQSEMTRS